MDRFWKHMEEKGFAKVVKNMNGSFTVFLFDNSGNPCLPTKEMLIGYMMDYLLSTGNISFRQIGIWLAEEIKESYFEKDNKFDGDNYIEIIYGILKKKIERLE